MPEFPLITIPAEPIQKPGPELLKALVSGDGIPQLRRRAMQYARDLYGQEAELRVESCSPIRTRVNTDGKGDFGAEITIRCLNFPHEAL